MNNIILIGFKSCGKTTLGKLYCAQNPEYKFIDTDDLIKANFYSSEQNNDSIVQSIGQVYKQLGDKSFRELEAKVIADLVVDTAHASNIIIATGGGSILNLNNIDNLKKIGTIIYLDCDPKVIEQRWLQNNIQPNFITDNYTFEDYIQDRSKLYQQAADKIFDVTDLKLTEVCDFGE